MGPSLSFTNPHLEIRGLQLNPIYNVYGEIYWDWWRHLDFPHLPHSVWYRCLTVKGGDDIDKVTSYSQLAGAKQQQIKSSLSIKNDVFNITLLTY